MTFTEDSWVQALETIEEHDYPRKGYDFTHAKVGAIGHVLQVRRDGLLDVFFERSGGITVVHPDQIKWVGDSRTGK